ncbi:MAG: TonB-dependent receptor [Ferruginibacter sp.]|nr:TonB-dependent receptor [Cytophagales bacterium]
MKKIVLSFFLLAWMAAGAFAQTGNIVGMVYDSTSRAPLAGATVTLPDQKQGAITDGLGRYTLSNLPTGTVTLRVSYVGYQATTTTREVKASETAEADFYLSRSTLNLNEVTIASGRDPSRADLINQIDRQLRPVNSAQDLLTLVPGLFIAQHAGGGKAEQIFIRGFDVDHGTDFQISVDGLPVNMVSHAHGQGYADFHFVIPETVDALRVYKGPYNVQFGDFATSGAGAFTTRNFLEKNEIKVEAGQFDTYRALATVNLLGGSQPRLSKRQENAYVAAEYVFTNAYFDRPQKFNRYNLFGKYHGLLTERTSLTVSGSTFNAIWDASGQIPQRSIDDGTISRFGSIDDSEGGNTSRSNANLILTTGVGRKTIFKNQLYYVNYKFSLYSNFTFFLEDQENGDEINQVDDRNIYGYQGTLEHEGRLGDKPLRTTVGVGTRIDDADITLRRAVRRNLLDTLVTGALYQQNASAYLDEKLELTNRLTLNLGLRADYFDFKFANRLDNSQSGRANQFRVSPKLNLYYTLSPSVQLFAKSGIGFHSNDARAVVVGQLENTLPKAFGSEVGATFKAGRGAVFNVALWGLDLENELVYVGDAGVTELSGATRRLGTDFSARIQLTRLLFADVDVNWNRGRLRDAPEGENYIPLAPRFTTVGGVSIQQPNGFNASLRYRHVDSRPANETNSVVARGYFLLDAVAQYVRPKYRFGLSVENVLNVEWNQAQFDTESRLRGEEPVSELHFTPGTPFFLKGSFSFYF